MAMVIEGEVAEHPLTALDSGKDVTAFVVDLTDGEAYDAVPVLAVVPEVDESVDETRAKIERVLSVN